MEEQSSKNINQIIENYHISVEEFTSILFKGFYYIHKNDIYWEPNAVFIGNGLSGAMLRTYPVGIAGQEAHAFDWHKKDSVFYFKDYNKTWSTNREVLEAKLTTTPQNIKIFYFNHS